jgi:hypothetical protein
MYGMCAYVPTGHDCCSLRSLGATVISIGLKSKPVILCVRVPPSRITELKAACCCQQTTHLERRNISARSQTRYNAKSHYPVVRLPGTVAVRSRAERSQLSFTFRLNSRARFERSNPLSRRILHESSLSSFRIAHRALS